MTDRPITFDTYVQEKLFERRVVVAQGFLDDERATRTAAQLLTLEALADEPMRLHMASPGGDIGAALSLVDTVQMLGVELTAVAVGEVSGASVAVVAAAPRRLAYRHARFGLTEPESPKMSGTADQMDTVAREYLRMRGAFVDLLAEATGRQAEAIDQELRRGRFLTAEEAVGYGLVGGLATG